MSGRIDDIIDVGAIQKQIAETEKALDVLSVRISGIVTKLKLMFDEIGASEYLNDLISQHKEFSKQAQKSNRVMDEQAKLQKQLEQLREKEKLSLSDTNKEIIKLRESIRENNQELKSQTKLSGEYTGSLTQMRARLSLLTKQYAEMSKAQREASEGTELRDSIKMISDQLKEAEGEIGNFSRSVGDYEGAIKRALPAGKGFIGQLVTILSTSGGVKTALASLGVALKALAMNPFILVAGAIAGLFKAIQSAVRGSEERFDRLREALAPFQVVIQLVRDSASAVADVFVSMAEAVGRAFTAISNFLGLGSRNQRDADAFVSAEQKRREALQATREFALTEARESIQIAELRNKAQQKEVYTSEQRIEFMQKAIDKEKSLADERLRIAKLELDAFNARNRLSEASTRDIEEYNRLRAAVYGAERSRFENTRRMEQQLGNFRREEARERERLSREAEANSVREARISIQKDIDILKSLENTHENRVKLAKMTAQLNRQISRYDENRASEIIKINRRLALELAQLEVERGQQLQQEQIRRYGLQLERLRGFSQEFFDISMSQLDKEQALAIEKARIAGENVELIYKEFHNRRLALQEQFTQDVIARNEFYLRSELAERQHAFEVEIAQMRLNAENREVVEEQIQRKRVEFIKETNRLYMAELELALQSENLTAEKREQLSNRLHELIRKNELKTLNEKIRINDIERREAEQLTRELINLGRDVVDAAFTVNIRRVQSELDALRQIRQANNDMFREQEENMRNAVMSDALREAERIRMADERRKAEEQLAKKEAQLRYEQAKLEQRQALIQAIIQTALSIATALPNIPLSILAGATGAVQIGLIASQSIPRYEKGGTNISGLGLWGEVRPEVAVSKTGEVAVAYKPTITDFEPGTTIFPSIEKYQQHVENTSTTAIDYNKMDEIMKRNKAVQMFNFNRHGILEAVNSDKSKTTYINRSLSKWM